jgi:cyclopropane-fatty-acyl-phospholipid synthase
MGRKASGATGGISMEAGLPAYSGATSSAVTRHYDVSNDFFRLWLDESMTYSCALWDMDSTMDTLELAQARKIDYIASEACVSGAGRVLDVGCGWGGTMERLVDVHGASKVVGLTLSDAQAAWVRGLDNACCEVRVENWIDHEVDQPYDAIISIGAFEHFTRRELTRQETISCYRDFFRACQGLLVDGGRLVLETIIKGNQRPTLEDIRDARLILEHVFHESQLPWFGQLFEASERLFEPIAVRVDGPHYAKTTAEWARRLGENRSAAVKLVGPDRVELYERYLAACTRLFERQQTNLVRVTFESTQ